MVFSTQVVFKAGDFYIYRGLSGENVLWVRSREGHWHRMFTEASAPSTHLQVNDQHIEDNLKKDCGILIRYGHLYADGVNLKDRAGNIIGRIID